MMPLERNVFTKQVQQWVRSSTAPQRLSLNFTSEFISENKTTTTKVNKTGICSKRGQAGQAPVPSFFGMFGGRFPALI